MAATSESSNDHTVSLPLIDLRLLSQSELYTLSLSASTGRIHRSDDDTVIPKIDRSVFNLSAGSRKQTFSRLRLGSRNDKQKSTVRASASSSSSIHIPEPVDGDNSKVITLLQNLFGVESLRGPKNDGLVPVQVVEFKQPSPEYAAQAIQNIPIDVVDRSQRKRKRGRPSRNEIPGTRLEDKGTEDEGKAVETVKEKKGFVVNDVGDPFGEELIGRTQGLETESQLLEFLEGLHGEWGSKRKKRRIVEASDLCDLLPTGWKLVLILQRRAGRASVVCRRYVSPDGRYFDSYKDVSSYLVSVIGVQDLSNLKSSYTGDSQQFSSNINMASERQSVGHVPTGSMEIDAHASSHDEKQAAITVSSSIGTEKLNTSDGNFNSDLALDCKFGDITSGAFRDSDHQTEDKQPLKADKNDANSVQGCSLAEDRVYNVRNEKMAGAIEAGDAACNLYVPLVFTTPLSDNNSGIDQFSDEINAVTCIKGGIDNFDSQDKNTGCYETVPCGNEQVHVDENRLGLSVPLVEDHVQKIGFASSMLVPNSEGKVFAGKNLEDRHLISSLEDMQSNGGKLVKDDNQIFSSRDQSEIKDVSSNVNLQFSSEGSLVPSQNELKYTSTNSMDRTLTSVMQDSAEGNFFDNDFPCSSIDERTFLHSGGYINDVSFSDWPQDALESGEVDFASNLDVAKDVSDNHVPPNEEVVTSSLQKRSSLNDQVCTMDDLLHRSPESSLFTLTGYQHPSAFHDNMNNISTGTIGALKPVDAGCMKPQLGIVSCSNVAAIDSNAAPGVVQGRSQGFASVPPGGSILNQFDRQNDNGVNKENKSCLSEKTKSEVEIFQTDSTGMLKFR